jgi:hypothetical protein
MLWSRFLRPVVFLLTCLVLDSGRGSAAVNRSPEWKWSNPSPFGNAVNDLAWRTNRLYLAAGERGVLHVADALPSWRRVDTDTLKSLRAATYLGGRAVVVGESGVVLWSDSDQFQKVETGRTNWLEGVAASADRAVAVGDAGIVLVSTNGVVWTAGSTGSTNWLRGITYSAGLFVAVGDSGYVASSPDGRTWTVRAAGRSSANLNQVVATSTGVFAVGDNGSYLSSRGTPLTQWDVGRVNTTFPLTAAVASGSERVVVGTGEVWFGLQIGNSFVWSSEINGLRSSPAPVAEYLSLISDGTRLIAGTRNGEILTATRSLSFVGYSWSYTDPPGSSAIWDSLVVGTFGTNVSVTIQNGIRVFSTNSSRSNFRVTVGERAQFLDSGDTLNWNRGLAPASASNTDYFGIGGREGILVAAGSRGALARSAVEYLPSIATNSFTNGTVVTRVVLTNQVNVLGIAWDALRSGVTNDLQGVAASSNLFVVTGGAGTVLSSPDGMTWTRRTSGSRAFLSSVAAWPGGFVATGEQGTLLTSADGIQWTPRPPLGTNWLWRVRWLEDRLVAVGQGGGVYFSTDATDWVASPTGTNVWWNDVARVDGAYYLVGDSGMVGISEDLHSWTLAPAITLRNLYTVSALDGRLVAAGSGGGILRARISPFDSPVRLLGYPKSPSENLFLFGGELDQRFVLDRSTDLLRWEQATTNEITDSQGLLILLDNGTNALPVQFFRSRSR